MRKIRFPGWKKIFEKVRKWRMPDLRLRYKLLLYLVTLFCAGMSMVRAVRLRSLHWRGSWLRETGSFQSPVRQN